MLLARKRVVEIQFLDLRIRRDYRVSHFASNFAIYLLSLRIARRVNARAKFAGRKRGACERCVDHTSSYNECGVGPLSVGVIGSPKTSHADRGFMTPVDFTTRNLVYDIACEASIMSTIPQVILRPQAPTHQSKIRARSSPCVQRPFRRMIQDHTACG